MDIFKELADTYKLSQDMGKIRTAHTVINRITDVGISAKMLKDYLGCTDWYEIIESKAEEFFRDMFSTEEADLINTRIMLELQSSPKYEEAQVIEASTLEEEEERLDYEVIKGSNGELDVKRTENVKIKEVSSVDKGLSAGLTLNIPIDEIIRQAVANEAPHLIGLLQADLEERIKKASLSLQPNIIQVNNVQTGEVVGKMHSEFAEALTILTSQGKLFLKGDAGTGKTFLAEQLAEALGLRFDSLSLTAGISEGYLIGRTNIQGEFISTSFIEIYENGGVFLLDEVDASDANTLLILNKAIAGSSMPVPMRTGNAEAKRHKDFYIVCASNTWGNGADVQYSGREYLDEAFLNRFSASKLVLDYDIELEKELLADAPKLCERLHKLRDDARENNLQRTISTRTLIDAFKYHLAGKTIEQVLHRVTIDYTQEELDKVR